jgi:hypothetical protein
MTDKPKVNIKGKVQDLKKTTKNEQSKKTNFLLTINTNCSYKEDDPNLEDDIKIFDEAINEILNDIDQYITLPEKDKWDEKTIEDANIEYTIERGSKKGHLHLHVLLKFKHKTRIQLNYQKIKDKLKKDLDRPNIYLYNRLIRNTGAETVLEYINKYT